MIKLINESEDKEKHLKTFEVSFDKQDIEKFQLEVEKKLSKNVEIKGFRKGKAPIEEAKKHLNPQKVLTDTVDVLSNEGYDWIIDQYYDDDASPKKEIDFFIEKPKADLQEFKNDEATIKYTFFLFPEIKINWDKLESKVSKKEVAQEEIQAKIDRAIENHSTLEPKGDDAILEKNDDAVFDFEGKIDGEVFEGGSAKSYELVIGSNAFIPNFEDQMVGMKANEERDIKVRFPEDYSVKHLADKEAIFHVKVNEIKKVVKPEYNDEFVKSLNLKNVSDDKELRDFYKKELEEQNNRTYEDDVNKEISELLIKNTEISYLPEFLVENEEKRMNNELLSMLSQYNIKFEDYLKIINTTQEELNKNFHEESQNRIRLDIAVNKISKEKGIQPTKEEIRSELDRLEQQYNPEHKKEMTERINAQAPLVTASIIQKMVYKYLFDLLTKK